MVESKPLFTPILLGLLCLIGTNVAYAANIVATTDRPMVREGESFQLTLEVTGSVDDEPDFSPLEKDFEILNRNKSSSMQFINGSVSHQQFWLLSLMPKQIGELIVPSIAFGSDQSNPLHMSISQLQTSTTDAAAEDIFLQVSAEPQKAYVQAQLIYTVQIYIASNIANASLSEPSLSDADAVVEKLGDDRRFEQNLRGRHYQIIERRYAIFPQQSGKLTFEPVIFNAQVLQTSGYGRTPFQQYGQSLRIPSRSIEVEILAKPDSQQSGSWLPARSLQLEENWPQEPTTFSVGEAITRTITLSADGLTAAQLPEITAPTPTGIKAYPDQPVLQDKKNGSGVIGKREQKIAMIATRPGLYELPEITLLWWNTNTQQMQTARIAKRTVKVLTTAGNSSNNPEPNQRTKTATELPILKPVATANNSEIATSGFWPWLSLLLTTGWLATLIFTWRQYRHQQQTSDTEQRHKANAARESRRQAEKRLKQACLDNNLQASKEALLAWGRLIHQEHDISSLTQLGKHLTDSLAEAIKPLNQALYSPTDVTWQGLHLWQAVEEYNTEKKTGPTKKTDPLTPLYP